MGLAVLGAFLVYGTLEPGAIVAHGRAEVSQLSQLRVELGHLPGSRSASSCSSPRRSPRPSATPFDIPEGEPEIIGYFVEYSGLRFGMFFLAEFLEIVFVERDHDHRVLRRLAPPGGGCRRAGWPRTCRTSRSCC